MTWFEPVLAGAVLPSCVVAYVVLSLTQHRRKVDGYDAISLRLPWFTACTKPPVDYSVEVGAMVVPAEKAPVVASSKGASPFPDLWNPPMTSHEREQMAVNKTLYHKLQNVEDHPGESMPPPSVDGPHPLTFGLTRSEVIDESRTRLLQLFDISISEARRRPAGTILELPPTFSKDALRHLLALQHRSTCHRYEAYCQRKAQGSPRENFPNRDFAVQWLRLASCVKYVDGSWVGNGLSAATRRGDRLGTKKA